MYICNAFSLNMISQDVSTAYLRVRRVSQETARRRLTDAGFVSAVGHEGTAQVLSQRLGMDIPAQRISITLREGQSVIVAQIAGRLPEGTVLSAEQVAGLSVAYYEVTVEAEI